eukprot:COSAG01_NODE_2119_length_8380_cov_44.533510_7_plen_85_part_00
MWREPRGGSRGAYLREDYAREGTTTAGELRIAKPAHHKEGGGIQDGGTGAHRPPPGSSIVAGWSLIRLLTLQVVVVAVSNRYVT